MSRHFVTLRFIPGEYRDFDAKDGVFECSVDVHSVIAQLEEGGQVPSMEEFEKLELERDNECEREEAAYWQQEFSAERTKYLNEIEKLKDRIVELETKLQELGCDDH